MFRAQILPVFMPAIIFFTLLLPINGKSSTVNVSSIPSCRPLLETVVNSSLNELPFFVFKIEEQTGRRFFDTAVAQWNQRFNPQVVINIIDAMDEGLQLPTVGIDYIKDMKELGSSVRLAFRFFTYEHKIPAGWQFVAKKLGEIKDLEKLNRPEKIQSKILALKGWLESGGPDGLIAETRAFKSLPPAGIKRYLQASIAECVELLGREQLSGLEFHELKKNIWMLFELFQWTALSGEQTSQIPDQVFSLINKLMKKIHGPILQLKHLNGEKRKEDIVVLLPLELRQKLLQLLNKFQIQ